ncbi:tRNA pseudouridine(38-40) synthase TruA [Brunnivagina elsteri]|uniref:tRNA pseudouridine synthase A n=1 Tax=Brunnivagina elsteri CCALA 953 TaxID=987040 RepID=A0A2A2TJ29_9CYAN|nr:tRNA pseudouridine(38-40) synthase TruA [Calothrix elsteri]PAX54176.1 tRNA pseudouridine(38-40) synthase TruA [Calothrix elsteri CCALA 953]
MLESQTTEQERVALVIQYLGTHFHGWQRQAQHRSVQEEVEKAIAEIVGHHVNLHGAGRTDAGVHAAAQVAHFNVISKIPPHKWAAVLNKYLPSDILIRASSSVSPNWHAQYSAMYRRYRYTLYTDQRPNLFIKPFCWHYYHAPLDESLIQDALEPLVGKHDFGAFRRTNSKRAHSWVEVQEVTCDRDGSFIHIEIQADGFLYGMVRFIVGMLVQVAAGERTISNFTEIWKNQLREQVLHSAPAQGLCLLRVGYPDSTFSKEIWFDTQPKFVFSY